MKRVNTLAILAFILLIPPEASAQYPSFAAFTPPSKEYVVQSDLIEVTNLPKVPAQGGRGICYAASAAVVLTAENCLKLHEDCTRYTPDKIFSPYGLVKPFGEEDSRSHEPLADEGGSAINALNYAAYDAFGNPSLECSSKDKTMPDFATSDDGSIREYTMWNQVYNIYKNLTNTAQKTDFNCQACIEDFFNTHQTEFSTLKKIFPNIKEQSVSFLRLMREPTYRDFVVKLTVPIKCHRVANKVWLENAGKVDVAVYPPAGGDTTTPGSSGKETGQNKKPGHGNYKEAIAVIKTVLNSGRPLVLEGICLDKNTKGKKCLVLHTVVISGSKTLCDKKNQCLDVLKVINSWGDSWQKEVNDGWVQAKPLLDSTHYAEYMMGWLSDKAQAGQEDSR
ncbi:hypothetical protein DET60_101507 [Raoultella planticola]|uniref:hypothetical protein n=1 Tax=Raoultella planticola TaxID=575 RepID=UPI0010DEE062|nr:hypothetical protein [Raoultella planticola]TDV12873.1 hypothetical protein DFO76_101511 [Raoultella planticola]TDX41107.1 hypothetical protein DET60_101507 [Raoultella planticola]